MEKFSVVFHPCENLDHYVNKTHSFTPLYTHHFFNNDDNSSAIQWVKYDVFYIVDTFEMFIKLSGQLYMSKNDNDIGKALHCIYKSVYSTIPDHTLILDESIFKHLLYLRSMGSKNFIPPGRVLVEIPLDDSSIFQIRYCVFQEENGASNNVNNLSENNKSQKNSNPDSEYYPDLSESVYFKNSTSKFSMDSELYDECCMNISHKGNFDNCLIYDIINYINRQNRESTKSPRNSKTYDRLNFSVQENFNILHRRMEWFYHWFIEGASNIKPDPRWSVFIPIIIFTYESVDKKNNSTNNKISNMLTSPEYFKNVITKGLNDDESIRYKIMQEPLGVISELIPNKPKRSPKSKTLNKDYSVKVLGMVTAYYFFTLNNDRMRISQFMIFPNYCSKGFGLWVLEFIYKFAIFDCNVREITVEDPTSAFLVLRYVVALKLCFESEKIKPQILYGNYKNSLGLFKIFTKESTIPSREEISAICKESKSHSTRLVEILKLANMLPNPISSEFFVNRISNKRQKTNNIDVKLSLFVQSDVYNDFCDKLKHKLKLEELKSTGKSANLMKASQNKYLNSIDTFLDHMCNQTISGYIRVINKLRKIFPNER